MQLRWRRMRLALKRPFQTSQHRLIEKETLLVEFEHDGLIGRGEIMPLESLGQPLEASEAFLDTCQESLGDDPFQIQPVVDRLLAMWPNNRAAICGLDQALFDWAARRLGVPVAQLLGVAAPPIETAFTISAGAGEAVAGHVDEALTSGFTKLKVKVGVATDEETLSTVRSAFDGPLLVDANGAWSAAEALAGLDRVAAFRPTLIEQPLPRERDADVAALRGRAPAPLFADESCHTPADVLRLHGCVDGINIKLAKCGGLLEARRMIDVARVLGMQVMLGCYMCSSLAIAHSLALAPLVDHADLDGHLLLKSDPFCGLRLSGGRLRSPAAPGFGLELA